MATRSKVCPVLTLGDVMRDVFVMQLLVAVPYLPTGLEITLVFVDAGGLLAQVNSVLDSVTAECC